MIFKKLKDSWDSICIGCGQCCCEKIPVKLIRNNQRRIPGVTSINSGYYIDFSKPCSFLDIETGECLVYQQRFKVCKNCIPMTVLHAFFADYLPPDCAYVQKFRFWRKH